MGVSDRDPLFFPPAKYGDSEEPEDHLLEVDTRSQEKSLRIMLILGMVLALVVLLVMGSCYLKAPSGSPHPSASPDQRVR